MNVSTVKALCWLTSSALTAGLGLFLYDFFSNQSQASPFDVDRAGEILNRKGEVIIETSRSIDYPGEVIPAWKRLNWTGKEAPKPVVKAPEDTGPKGPQYTPVAELLSVSLITYDTIVPEDSSAFVRYLGNWTTETEARLQPGDRLPAPNDNVEVVAMTSESIEFRFEGMERENETLEPKGVAREALLEMWASRAPREKRESRLVAQGTWTTTETKQVGPNRWILGTEDVSYLNENFSEVLVRDLSHKTHYDQNGRRAGIELTRVRANSIAARHGASEGDVVISINGQPVNSAQEAINYAKNNAKKYSTWEVVVENLGARRTLMFESPPNGG